MPIVKRNRRRITRRFIYYSQSNKKRAHPPFLPLLPLDDDTATARILYLSQSVSKPAEREDTPLRTPISPFKLVFVAANHPVGRRDPLAEMSAKGYAG